MQPTNSSLRRATASLLAYALAASLLAGPVHAQASVPAQINQLPPGAKVQVLLKDKTKLRGTLGAISESGFTLLDSQPGARLLTFDEVASVRLRKSHTGLYVVLGVVTVVAVVLLVKAAQGFAVAAKLTGRP